MRPDIGGTIDMLGVEYVEDVDVAELESEEYDPRHIVSILIHGDLGWQWGIKHTSKQK